MPESSQPESSRAKPSSSLLLERASLSKVLELFQAQGLMDPLLQVLEAERVAHLEASVYSNNDSQRHEHDGVVKWIDAWLSGHVQSHYTQQAQDTIDDATATKRKPQAPQGGTAWMAPDALD